MIVIMQSDAPQASLDRVINTIHQLHLTPHVSEGAERTIIGIIGDDRKINVQSLECLPDVAAVVPVLTPFKLASREFHPEPLIIKLNDVQIGGTELTIMAGPCAVESREILETTARAVQAAGASILRGGVFKPRTSPYSFQGLGEQALDWLSAVGKMHQMPIVTEVMSPEQVSMVAEKADILQIGARNMQNFNLLEAVGETRRPVLLKRGPSATLDEWLLAAEYILARGNEQVMLCERGLRSFDRKYTRNVLDVSAVPVLKSLTHLPVIVDPSHAVGKWEWVTAVSRAAIAAGADGLIVEVHPHPEVALSDGRQSLVPSRFESLVGDVDRIARAVGRSTRSVQSQATVPAILTGVLP